MPVCHSPQVHLSSQHNLREKGLDHSNQLPFHVQTPFTLTLRLWDIYILEGERVLTAMAYTILKLHKSKAFNRMTQLFCVAQVIPLLEPGIWVLEFNLHRQKGL